MTTFTTDDREAAAIPMRALELADRIKDFYSHPNQPYFLIQIETALRQQQSEIEALKSFVKPILAHGDDCVGDWDGGELQDLAVKSGLYIEKTMTEPCNLGKEEFVGCPCREYSYGEDSWECYRIAEFLLDKEEN